MKKKIIFFITFVVLNCFLCTSVHGLEQNLEKSLFLSEDHWLSFKIRDHFQGKEYKKFLSPIVSGTDCKHIIVCKYGSNKASTDCRGNARILIPLKPKAEETRETTYKDCEDGTSGDISLYARFKKPQGEVLKEEDFVNLDPESAPYYVIGQKKIDEKLDSLIQQGEYSWINEGGVIRTLIATIDGSQSLGYLIEKRDGSKKVFWPTVHYCRFGFQQYDFKEWSTIKNLFDINSTESSMFGTGTGWS
ncbi:MAG: hypothetical protein LBI41_02010 [Lactobacillales bacterium]|nr:hypothetical protein [Lactobacillales bacterium]